MYKYKGGVIIDSTNKSAKTCRIDIRVSTETIKDIDYCANKMNTTRTNVILKGIEKVKAEIKK